MKINLNELYAEYKKDPLRVDEFATALQLYATRIVKSYCRRKDGYVYDVIEDAAGEAILKVWEALDGLVLNEDTLFSTWVTTCILNCIKDILRKSYKRKEILLDERFDYKGHSRFFDRLHLSQSIDTLDKDDRRFVAMKLNGESDAVIAINYGRNTRWAENKWANLKKKLSILVNSDV